MIVLWLICQRVFELHFFNSFHCLLFNEGHLEKLLADKKLDEGKRKEYESVIGQVIAWAYLLSGKSERGNF